MFRIEYPFHTLNSSLNFTVFFPNTGSVKNLKDKTFIYFASSLKYSVIFKGCLGVTFTIIRKRKIKQKHENKLEKGKTNNIKMYK